MNKILLNNNKTISISKTLIMGIINITDDSFYENSRVKTREEIYNKVFEFVNCGVDIIDLGAQSTRPGSCEIDKNIEEQRILFALNIIKKAFPDAIISIDTFNSNVAESALKNGAHIINDISAGEFDSNMINIVKKYNAPIILMHTNGKPKVMQENPIYKNVVKDVYNYLKRRVVYFKKQGITKNKIIIDPGIGFGKTQEHNLSLIKNINYFKKLKLPILVGVSRKSFIGYIQDEKNPTNRLYGTLATSVYLNDKNIDIIRVHDVYENQVFLKSYRRLK